jgi:uncharacterized membrane protein YbaN (DUF454 family)
LRFVVVCHHRKPKSSTFTSLFIRKEWLHRTLQHFLRASAYANSRSRATVLNMAFTTMSSSTREIYTQEMTNRLLLRAV